MPTPVEIDGNLGEGGGQVLRIAVCLSALYRIPIKVCNIRAGRPKPGLAAQHLKGIELVKEMCNAEVTGAHVGSTCLTFSPGLLQLKKQQFIADTKTAGCICLLVQIALPCALFSSTTATYILKGGTNVPMGPQCEYIKYVFKPFLNRFGADFDLDIIRRGYYPQGGGEVCLTVKPIHHLKSVELLQSGSPIEIKGWSHVVGLSINEAQKMSNDAKSTIIQQLKQRDISLPPIDITTFKETKIPSVGYGSAINLLCKTDNECIFGGSGLGSKRPGPIAPGIEAANDLLAPILYDSCVDEHLQDQMIIFMLLAKGHSKIKIGRNNLTSHAQTAMQIANIMLGDKGLVFSLSKNDSGSHIFECNGLDFVNKFIN